MSSSKAQQARAENLRLARIAKLAKLQKKREETSNIEKIKEQVYKDHLEKQKQEDGNEETNNNDIEEMPKGDDVGLSDYEYEYSLSESESSSSSEEFVLRKSKKSKQKKDDTYKLEIESLRKELDAMKSKANNPRKRRGNKTVVQIMPSSEKPQKEDKPKPATPPFSFLKF